MIYLHLLRILKSFFSCRVWNYVMNTNKTFLVFVTFNFFKVFFFSTEFEKKPTWPLVYIHVTKNCVVSQTILYHLVKPKEIIANITKDRGATSLTQAMFITLIIAANSNQCRFRKLNIQIFKLVLFQWLFDKQLNS